MALGSVSGERRATIAWPSRRRAASSAVGRCTFTMQSAVAYTSSRVARVAPASSKALSGKEAATPAPRSTTTSTPAALRRPSASGTRATRRSPGRVSRGTPTFMRAPGGLERWGNGANTTEAAGFTRARVPPACAGRAVLAGGGGPTGGPWRQGGRPDGRRAGDVRQTPNSDAIPVRPTGRDAPADPGTSAAAVARAARRRPETQPPPPPPHGAQWPHERSRRQVRFGGDRVDRAPGRVRRASAAYHLWDQRRRRRRRARICAEGDWGPNPYGGQAVLVAAGRLDAVAADRLAARRRAAFLWDPRLDTIPKVARAARHRAFESERDD